MTKLSSVHSVSCVWLFVTPGLQHMKPPCPSPTPGACSDSCPSSQWCHPTISSSVIPFSCLQSSPASGSFTMSQPFPSGGQSIGASTTASVLPMNIQDWFPLGLTGLIFLQSKGVSRVLSKKKQDGGRVGGCGIHLSPRIHQECTFRHTRAWRTPTESISEYLTSRKENIDSHKTQ